MTGPGSAAARESARGHDGRFGVQVHAEAADIDLGWDGAEEGQVDTDLAYLRRLLDGDTGSGDEAGAAARYEPGVTCRDQTVTGADLPPLVFSHPSTLDVSAVEPVGNANHSKPDGGLWLSPGSPDEGSEWDRLMDSEEYHGSGVDKPGRIGQVVSCAPEARVLRIDSRADLLAAADAFPAYAQGEEVRGFFGMRAMDWKQMSQHYDALWVTSAGVGANHMHPDDRAESLYSWDIETVWVTNPSVLRTEDATA